MSGLRINDPLLLQEDNPLLEGLKVLVDKEGFTAAKTLATKLLGNTIAQGRVGAGDWGAVAANSTGLRFSTDGGTTWSGEFTIPTGAGIVALLTALEGENRLSLNALKDIPDTITNEFDYVQFVLSAVNSFGAGKLYWDAVNKVLNYDTETVGYSFKIPRDSVQLVTNNSGTLIIRGRVVAATGATGGLPTVVLADPSTYENSNFLGFVVADIANGASGYIIRSGVVSNINTSSFEIGDTVYLGSGGTLTTTIPTTPNYAIRLGMVLTKGTSGSILLGIGSDYDSSAIRTFEKIVTNLGNAVTSVTRNNDKLIFHYDIEFATKAQLDDKVDRNELDGLLNLQKDIFTITLPDSFSVAGRCAAAVAGTDYPTGWTIAADLNPIDFKVTHGMDRRIVSVSIYSVDGNEERQLFGNAAYSGIVSPDKNSVVIESLATIQAPIVVHLVFSDKVGGSFIVVTLASVTTYTPANITSSSFNTGGNVSDSGNSIVTECGICYATHNTPTVADTKVVSGSGVGAFYTAVTGLTAATTYYYRAYAINSKGTSYGSIFNFNTAPA